MADPALVERAVRYTQKHHPHWLRLVPHASAVAAEAFVRHSDLPKPLLFKRLVMEIGTAARDAKALRRGPPPTRLTVEPSDAATGLPGASRDELEGVLRRRGLTPTEARVMAAWLSGESGPDMALRLGLPWITVRRTRQRAREALGLTLDEVRALIGLARGEALADVAAGAWHPVRAGCSKIGRSHAKRRARRRRQAGGTVDPSTVCLRQQRALAKLRGVVVCPDKEDS